jgi:hypothetical protein
VRGQVAEVDLPADLPDVSRPSAAELMKARQERAAHAAGGDLQRH